MADVQPNHLLGITVQTHADLSREYLPLAKTVWPVNWWFPDQWQDSLCCCCHHLPIA